MTTWGTRLFGVGCLLLVLTVGFVGGGLLSLSAPYSGTAWETVEQGQETVETPYGPATVTYDRYGVPQVNASSTEALYYAVGYVQARDRLFQMDLFRRQMRGNLSEVFGEATVESDRFHREMDFGTAADRQWASLQGTELEEPMRAYAAGVNEYIDTGTLPLEFRLNDYRPREWSPEDTLVVGKRATWGLSGEFSDLQRATVEQRVPGAASLYPDRLDHDASVLELAGDGATDSQPTARSLQGAYADLYESLSAFDRPPGAGSNNWVVSGNRSATGEPMLANDPHLQLFAPPVWYEMQLSSPELIVHGVAFPGVPMALIGQTDGVAWGITNVGADVTDLYTYEWRGDQYYHEGEWHDATVETETISVRDGPDETVEVRKTVHGPVLEREGQTVAVAWLGLTDTREPLAFYGFNRAEDMAEFRTALQNFDLPSQNIVAASEDATFYRPSGTYPIRRTNGTVVRGDQVFNGSADEGRWLGFDPYGESNFTGPGFVDYDRVPSVENPAMLGTANQRAIDDPEFYLGTSSHFADPYRGERIDQLLEANLEDDGVIDRQEMRAMQRDVHSLAAEQFVPHALNATGKMSPQARKAAERFEEWDYEMRKESRAALVYDRWLVHYRNMTFADEYYHNGLDRSYYPHHWTFGRLPADSQWFDDRSTRAVETRADIAARAMNATVREIETNGWETYGDVNRLEIEHPFGRAGAVSFLNYPTAPMDGSPFTLFNFRADTNPQTGSSWRMIVGPDGGTGVRPGGNSGNYWSDHYVGELDAWRRGQYHSLWIQPDGPVDIRFEEEDE